MIYRVVHDRDNGCIFCRMGYSVVENSWLETMHFVPRSQGGRGIPENLAVGCAVHHRMLDESSQRPDMLILFERYLKKCYPDWEKEKLIYHKGGYDGQ